VGNFLRGLTYLVTINPPVLWVSAAHFFIEPTEAEKEAYLLSKKRSEDPLANYVER
jgi:hypothetical protein